MAGFLRGGMRPPQRSGGRESSMPHSGRPAPEPAMHNPMHGMSAGAENETRIIHHPSGEMEVHHSDGEVSKHPNAGHMAAHFHAKHMGGEVGNMRQDDTGKVTTHHVGADGEVSGPNEHATPEEGADHLAQMMSGQDENEIPGYGSGEPDGDEYAV